MEENEEEEIADVDAVSVYVGRDVVIGRKWRTKTRRKIKELEGWDQEGRKMFGKGVLAQSLVR